MELITVLYFLVCVSGWGLSSFLMGFLGKTLPFETGMLYQFLGSGLLVLLMYPRVIDPDPDDWTDMHCSSS